MATVASELAVVLSNSVLLRVDASVLAMLVDWLVLVEASVVVVF